MWGSTTLQIQDSYKHLGVWFTENGSWDKHVDEVLLKATRRVDQLTKFLTAPALTVPVKRQLIITCLLPIFDFGSSVWHVSVAQAKALGAQYRRAARLVLQCPVSTPVPAIMGDLGLAPLEQRWDLAKLRLQHQILRMSGERHPRIVHDMAWPGSGRHMWQQRINSIWRVLLPGSDSSSRLERQRLQQLDPKQFSRAMRNLINVRVEAKAQLRMRQLSKLNLYAQLHKAERQPARPYQLKMYLRGLLSHAVALKFKLRAGVAELQLEASRRSDGGCSASCPVCPEPVESVVHFLVQCPQYSEERAQLWIHSVTLTQWKQRLHSSSQRSSRQWRSWQTPCGQLSMRMRLQPRPSAKSSSALCAASWLTANIGLLHMLIMTHNAACASCFALSFVRWPYMSCIVACASFVA